MENRNAVIKGASRGLGKALAIQLADLGFGVALVARESEDLKQAKKGDPGKGGGE